MVPVWARAALSAAFLTLALTPLLRRVALATGFVDQPAGRKLHTRPVPYLGGVALITSVLIGMLFEPRLPEKVAVLALGGALLGTVGLLDDHRTVSPHVRFLAQGAAAAAAVAIGLRVHATGIDAVDVVLTLVWIVGITNAFNLLDNMDGLAAGVAASGGAAVFVLAVLGRQPVPATLAAALVGASLAFLVYNRRPATVFMGDAGSLFLGFVLALLTVDIDPALAPPASFAVPVLLLGLPILDTSTVTLARLRRGRSVLQGGKDHLSHRLVTLGLSTGGAVLVLVAVEVALGALAVLAGRRVMPLPWAVAAAATIVASLAVVTSRASVYTEPVVGISRRLKLTVRAGAGLLAVLAVPAFVGVARAHDAAQEGTQLAARALETLGQVSPDATAAQLREAHARFTEASQRVEAPLTTLGLVVPGLSSNLRATRLLVDAGRTLAGGASDLASFADATALQPADGAASLERLRRLEPALSRAAGLLAAVQIELAAVDQPYLVPSLRSALRDFQGHLALEAAATAQAADLARLLPGMAGIDGLREYLVLYQDSDELRATGGVFTSWARLRAENGHLALSATGTIEELEAARGGAAAPSGLPHLPGVRDGRPWSVVNASPDFRVVAPLAQQLYQQAGGAAIDGVVAFDARGLSALLELTGPVRAGDDPNPVGAHNLASVLQPTAGGAAERRGRLHAVVETAWRQFLSADLPETVTVGRALGRAARGGHLVAYTNHPQQQQLLSRLGVDGSPPASTGDSLLVVTQNLSGEPLDSALHRHIQYDIRLDPDGEPALVTGELAVSVSNDASPSAPENRSYLSSYNPFLSASTDGRGDVDADRHLERVRASMMVRFPPKQSSSVRMDVRGQMQLGSGGWYRLNVQRQPAWVPDAVDVTVSVPPGWRIADVRGGMRSNGSRRVTATLGEDNQLTLEARVERTAWSKLWTDSSDDWTR